MGDVLVRQTLEFLAAKNPTSAGAALTEKDFELSPAEKLEISTYNEDQAGRFAIPDGTADQSVGMGTVALGKILVLKPVSDIDVKIVNANGTSQIMKFIGGRTSLLHIEFTDVLLSNSSGSTIKGRYLVVGD